MGLLNICQCISNLNMKLTSKQKIITQSIKQKLQLARTFKNDNKFQESIQMYGKVLFLKEDPQYLIELAQLYENIMDLNAALCFYKRAYQLKPKPDLKERIKELHKIRGIQLLSIGTINNIVEDPTFQPFSKRYNNFHQKIYQKINKPRLAQHLLCCLAYLQVNYRAQALDQIESCIIIDEGDIQLKIMKALIHWSMMDIGKGYQQFWEAYLIDKENIEIKVFLEMVSPKIEGIYKEAKFDLIEKKMDRCRVKVKQGLEIHPYHTHLLILSSYLHRVNHKFQQSIADLEMAKKTLEQKSLESQIYAQFSLTYNQMGVHLYKQNQYKQAISLFNQALSYKQKDWSLYVNRGDCYRALNDHSQALDDYLHGFGLNQGNHQLRFRIGTIYHLRGINFFNSRNFDNALGEFNECIRYSPRCSNFHLSKAKCLLQMNQKNEGVASLEQALNIDPTLTEAIQLLEQYKQPLEKPNKVVRKVISLSKQK